jgi:hypothetical protein
VHELAVLKHVSYALEAFAADATSEGRSEVAFLLNQIAGDPELAEDCRKVLLQRLTRAQESIDGASGYRGARAELAAATSYLWKRVQPGWLYDRRE